jgi:hypothetical protein
LALEPYGSYSFLDSLLQTQEGGGEGGIDREPCQGYTCPNGDCVDSPDDCPPPDDDDSGGEECESDEFECNGQCIPYYVPVTCNDNPNTQWNQSTCSCEPMTGQDEQGQEYGGEELFPEPSEPIFSGFFRGPSEDRYTPDYEAMKGRIEDYYGGRGRRRMGGLLRSLITDA